MAVKINGRAFAFASLDLSLAGDPQDGFTAVNWEEELKGTKVRGKGAKAKARTRGDHDCNGSIEMLQQHWEVMKKKLAGLAPDGLSYGLTEFAAVATFSEGDADPMITRVLEECRVEKATENFKQGPDGNVVKLDLSIMNVADEEGISIYAGE